MNLLTDALRAQLIETRARAEKQIEVFKEEADFMRIRQEVLRSQIYALQMRVHGIDALTGPDAEEPPL